MEEHKIAGPFRSIVEATNPPPVTHARDIALLIDESGSMETAMRDGTTRCQAAMDAAWTFVTETRALEPGARISVIGFSSSPRVLCGLTRVGNSQQQIKMAIDNCTPGGGTEMRKALRAVRKKVLFPGGHVGAGKKQIVLLSDGENTGLKSPIPSATRLKNMGTEVHCVGVARRPTDVDHVTLRAIASDGCYKFIDDNPRKLVQHFGALANQLMIRR